MSSSRKASHVALALLVAAAILPTAPTPRRAFAAECDTSLSACRGLESAQGQAAANRDRLAQIEKQITDAQARMKALSALVSDLDARIVAEQGRIDQTEAALRELDREVRVAEAELARSQAHLAVRESLLGQRVRSMDQHSSVDYLELVLTSESFVQLVDRLMIMRDIVSSDRRLVSDLEADRVQLHQLHDRLEADRATQQSLLEEQRQHRAELEEDRQTEQAAYAAQAELEAQFEQQRADLERQQAEITRRIGDLRSQYRAQLAALPPPLPPPSPTPAPRPAPGPSPSPTPSAGGTPEASGFLWPQASHLITQGFGCTDLLSEPYNPSCPTRHWHTGIDIAGPSGTPIYASAAGVAAVYPGTTGYGNYVLLVHAGGYSTLYGHLSGFAVASGQVVAQGQVIGYEGSTGNSTGPHLHFEIRYQDAYQDPCAYVSC